MVLDHLNVYEQDVTVLDHLNVYNQDVTVLDHLNVYEQDVIIPKKYFSCRKLTYAYIHTKDMQQPLAIGWKMEIG